MTRRQFYLATVLICAAFAALFFFPGRQAKEAKDSASEAIQKQQQLRQDIREFQTDLGKSPTTEQVRRLLEVLTERTGTNDAPQVSTSGERSPTPRPTLFRPGRPPRAPRDPFPQRSPSPGTLKPLLCAQFPQTMAELGVDCKSDTFVFCDLTGVSCPATPPEPTAPVPTAVPASRQA